MKQFITHAVAALLGAVFTFMFMAIIGLSRMVN